MAARQGRSQDMFWREDYQDLLSDSTEEMRERERLRMSSRFLPHNCANLKGDAQGALRA